MIPAPAAAVTSLKNAAVGFPDYTNNMLVREKM